MLFVLLVAVENVFLIVNGRLSYYIPALIPIGLAWVFIQSGLLCRMPDIIVGKCQLDALYVWTNNHPPLCALASLTNQCAIFKL